MTDEKYEAVRRENAWDDEACGDRIARVDVVDVCGMVLHFIEVRNEEMRIDGYWDQALGGWGSDEMNGVATHRYLRDHRPW